MWFIGLAVSLVPTPYFTQRDQKCGTRLVVCITIIKRGGPRRTTALVSQATPFAPFLSLRRVWLARLDDRVAASLETLEHPVDPCTRRYVTYRVYLLLCSCLQACISQSEILICEFVKLIKLYKQATANATFSATACCITLCKNNFVFQRGLCYKEVGESLFNFPYSILCCLLSQSRLNTLLCQAVKWAVLTILCDVILPAWCTGYCDFVLHQSYQHDARLIW